VATDALWFRLSRSLLRLPSTAPLHQIHLGTWEKEVGYSRVFTGHMYAFLGRKGCFLNYIPYVLSPVETKLPQELGCIPFNYFISDDEGEILFPMVGSKRRNHSSRGRRRWQLNSVRIEFIRGRQ
jgi:hypothetical protein